MQRSKKLKVCAFGLFICLLGVVAALIFWPARTLLPPWQGTIPLGDEQMLEFVRFLTGPGEGDNPAFVQPMAVAFDAEENIYVSDTGLHRVVVFNRDGEFLFTIGGPGAAYPEAGIPAGWRPGLFNYPYGLDVGEDRRLYVADMLNRRIQIFDLQGQFLDWFPQNPGSGEDLFPRAVIMRHGLVYIANPFQILVYTPDGKFMRSFGKPGQKPGEFWQLNGLAVAEDGTIFVSDSLNQRLQAFSASGELLWYYTDVVLPRQMAINPAGRIFVADAFSFNIRLFSQAGEQLATVGERGTQPLQFGQPTGIAISSGGLMAVVERTNNRVQIMRLLPAK